MCKSVEHDFGYFCVNNKALFVCAEFMMIFRQGGPIWRAFYFAIAMSAIFKYGRQAKYHNQQKLRLTGLSDINLGFGEYF